MTLDPNTATFLEQIAGVVPPLPSLDDDAGLAAYFDGLAESTDDNTLEGEAEPVASVENRTVPGPRGDVRIRIYRPDDSSLPVIVFFHGGVFIMGGLEMHDPVEQAFDNRRECRNCHFLDGFQCQVVDGQEPYKACPALEEHIRFNGIRIYGVNR